MHLRCALQAGALGFEWAWLVLDPSALIPQPFDRAASAEANVSSLETRVSNDEQRIDSLLTTPLEHPQAEGFSVEKAVSVMAGWCLIMNLQSDDQELNRNFPPFNDRSVQVLIVNSLNHRCKIGQ